MKPQLEMFDEPPAPEAHAGELAPEPLLALTLHQPWAYAVLYLGKDIENRDWRPWPRIIGRTIALAAAARVKPREEEAIARKLAAMGLALPPLATLARGAIIGTARVTGFVEKSRSPWFFGPYGWTLDQVRPIATPQPCRGFHKLWTVPPDLAARVRAAGEAAVV